MNETQKKVRALGLCSGGLDSCLAAAVLQTQGIEVHWITFETPFFSADKARDAAARQNIPLTVSNITGAYLPMLKNPPCGYGKNMNPCMDCHALMFRLAGEVMTREGFQFLFSGEVVGQRPMSQRKPSLRYVEKNSGYDGYILRPLSAKLLPETVPEKEGLVDRGKLLNISGRSRSVQIELAKTFGITDYPSPAGGCLLTDEGYSSRLKDLFSHGDHILETALHLLKFGRHFRLPGGAKIIVGRTQAENAQLEKYYTPSVDTLIRLARNPGPTVLIPSGVDAQTIRLAAALAVGYGKIPEGTAADVRVTTPAGTQILRVLGILPEDVRRLLV